MKTEFKATKLNGSLKKSTILTTLLLILILAFVSYNLLENNNEANILVLFFVWVIIFSIYTITYNVAPNSFILDGENAALIVNRNRGKVILDLSGLNEVIIGKKENYKRSIRKFGIGGLFSNYGDFSNKILGWYKMYCTDMNKTLILKTSNETFVISPEDLESCKEALEKFIKK